MAQEKMMETIKGLDNETLLDEYVEYRKYNVLTEKEKIENKFGSVEEYIEIRRLLNQEIMARMSK